MPSSFVPGSNSRGKQEGTGVNIRGLARTAFAVGATLAVLSGVSTAASDAKSTNAGMLRLLKILHARGSISDAEYEELQHLADEDDVAPTAAQATPSGPAPDVIVPASAATHPAAQATPAAHANADPPSPAPTKPATPAWYERLAIRGYVQVRHHSILSQHGADLDVPADRSVSDTDTFLIRRGRLILFGDVSDHVYVYAQPDMFASPTTGDFALQMRDLYADISVDRQKEFRFRVGQSKVPFGFVNLQSSQNRIPVERPDALNSAVEGERDIGAFFYWAPAEIRNRFRTLVSSGLRGSGDYGVFGFGAYSGQGLNRRDLNGAPHYIARLSYPFQLPNGQFVEVGAQAYTGRFVVRTEELTVNGNKQTPSQPKNGVADERIGATFVWYPQPFGIEAEWNFGHGPRLSRDATRIESRGLHGGYLQFSYRLQNLHLGTYQLGEASPFTRWNYYDGGRKFGRNAAASLVNEVDVGIEWQPIPSLELLLAYTPTFTRTNTSSYPFRRTENAQRIGVQLQFNY